VLSSSQAEASGFGDKIALSES
jgi:hypothetical protein